MKAPHNEIITLDSYSTVDNYLTFTTFYLSGLRSSISGIIHQTSCALLYTVYYFLTHSMNSICICNTM